VKASLVYLRPENVNLVRVWLTLIKLQWCRCGDYKIQQRYRQTSLTDKSEALSTRVEALFREYSFFSLCDETKASTLVDKASDLSVRGVWRYPSWIPLLVKWSMVHKGTVVLTIIWFKSIELKPNSCFLVLDKLNLLSSDLTQVILLYLKQYIHLDCDAYLTTDKRKPMSVKHRTTK